MQVSVRQASRELSRLINAAAYGDEHVIITSRGRPKAILLSIKEYQRLSARVGTRTKALERARRLRKDFSARYGVLSVDLVHAARDEREQRIGALLTSEGK